MDQFISLQVSLQPFGRSSNWAMTNEIKHEPVQAAAVDLLPNKSHAMANVSLLARQQEPPTATLNTFFSILYYVAGVKDMKSERNSVAIIT